MLLLEVLGIVVGFTAVSFLFYVFMNGVLGFNGGDLSWKGLSRVLISYALFGGVAGLLFVICGPIPDILRYVISTLIILLAFFSLNALMKRWIRQDRELNDLEQKAKLHKEVSGG